MINGVAPSGGRGYHFPSGTGRDLPALRSRHVRSRARARRFTDAPDPRRDPGISAARSSGTGRCCRGLSRGD